MTTVELPDNDTTRHEGEAERRKREPRATFSGHAGLATAAQWHPGVPAVFLTAGSDGTVQLVSSDKRKASLVFSAGAGGVQCAQWSPFREGVLAVGTRGGSVLVFDLSR